MTDQPNSPPYRGQIRRVEGRNTKGSKRTGLPKIHEIELEHQGGLRIEAHSRKPPTGDGTRTATGVCVIEPGRFPYRPICLREDIAAATMEHIPPKAFGGAVMANTCADCNNRLGSRTEAALQDWHDGAIQIHYTIPRPAEYLIGLLKSAYLAAFLHFGGVAHTDSLMAARLSCWPRATRSPAGTSPLVPWPKRSVPIGLVCPLVFLRSRCSGVSTKARPPF